ncbi:MAG: VacJ family lipoprotein [Halarcobacter sp.]
MRSLIIFIFIIITFNACTFTSHNRIDSNLELIPIPENERKTYVLFGKEQFLQEKENESDNFLSEQSFDDEYAQKAENADPLEPYNRLVTSFNDILYVNVLNPTARTYANVVHQDIRVGISNFFHNITFPIRFANNILQFKFSYASEELGRFLLNSTVGILGFMDPAKEQFNLQKREEDFGQTLGYYGFKEGFHIVLPILGPSNLRDLAGNLVDNYIDPLSTGEIKYKIPNNIEKTVAIKTFDTVNKISLNLGKYENVKEDAIDLYPFLKDIYTQQREKLIKE